MKIVMNDDAVYGYATGTTNSSGNGKWQWLLASALVDVGWSAVVGVRKPLMSSQEEIINGVRFVGMGEVETGIKFLPVWSRFLAAERPDWWYWQGGDPLWAALLVIARKKRVRGIFSTSFDRDVQPRLALTRRKILWPMYAWGLNTVDRIFVQHADQLCGLNRKLRSKAVVVPGVVALDKKVKSPGERGNYVAWVAVVREPKRPDLLIELARKNPGIRFLVCGAPSDHRSPPGYGERMVRELRSVSNVEYLGQVNPTRALEVIGDAKALLSTSDQEGFPNTFLESWSAGTPVVSLNIDPGGVIRKRGLGFVSGSVDRAGSDLGLLLGSPETFETFSKCTRRYIEEVHSSSAVARVVEAATVGAK